jgi:hypothetical protein
MGAFSEIFGPYGPVNSMNSTLAIGNVDVKLLQFDTASNTNPAAAFVHDLVHPHTTIQGIIANLVLEGLNTGYGADVPLLSEQEILAHAGIAYGGSDTLVGEIGNYSDYVTNYVPEPSTWALATIALVGLLVNAALRLRNNTRRGWHA